MICNDCKKECDNFPKVTECKTCGDACKACADECQMKKLISVRQALEDPAWLGSMLGGESFAVMRTLLIAAMSEALTAAEMHIFTQLTGRVGTPDEAVEELWVIAGRRIVARRAP